MKLIFPDLSPYESSHWFVRWLVIAVTCFMKTLRPRGNIDACLYLVFSDRSWLTVCRSSSGTRTSPRLWTREAPTWRWRGASCRRARPNTGPRCGRWATLAKERVVFIVCVSNEHRFWRNRFLSPVSQQTGKTGLHVGHAHEEASFCRNNTPHVQLCSRLVNTCSFLPVSTLKGPVPMFWSVSVSFLKGPVPMFWSVSNGAFTSDASKKFSTRLTQQSWCASKKVCSHQTRRGRSNKWVEERQDRRVLPL